MLLATALTVLEVRRVAPFVDDVDHTSPVEDDWIFYKRYAVSIVNDGLSMPVVEGKYRKPAGFLYNYFVAAIFAFAGVNSTYVYVVQAALLGLSVGVMCFALRRDLPPLLLWLVFFALAAFMYLDQFRNYTSRLLSENLAIFLIPICFLLVLEAHRKQSALMASLAGIVIGLAVLTRPNLILFPMAAAVLLIVATQRGGRKLAAGRAVALLVGCMAMIGLLMWRNYAAAGQFAVRVPTNVIEQSLHVSGAMTTKAGPVEVWVRRILRRTVFSLGFLRIEQPSFRNRPHWLAAWIGVTLWAIRRARSPKFVLWEMLLAFFIVVSLGPVILLSSISNYGFRMVMPTIPALVVLGVYGATAWLIDARSAAPPSPRC